MSTPIDDLEPKIVWKYFGDICRIPHGSRNEKALGEAVISWARARGFVAEMDPVGNVVIRVPASPGKEQAPIAVLQGHLDMVCEKNSDKKFDFEKDAIQLVRDGDWIKADGTTLGADNGIGVAMALAFMDMKDAVHGPLELLFTVDEETGLNGAIGLSPDLLKGRLLLNMDSEEAGVFYVGCAGGRDSNIALPVSRASLDGESACLAVEVKGLRGGHSGLDIVTNRGNALRLLARALESARGGGRLRLVSIEGGDKHNAIPREARAIVAVDAGGAQAFERAMAECQEAFRTEFASAEPGLAITCAAGQTAAEALTEESTAKALALLLALPHGVLAMSRDLAGLVETSSNLARVRTEGNAITILKSSRSSVASALDGVIASVRAVGALAGAKVEHNKGYPGWQPDMSSKLLALGKRAWEGKYGQTPRYTAIHAGLECGLIGEKFPGMDMISFGPTIQNPHSPDERVSIESVRQVFDFTKAFLAEIAKG